MVDADTYHQLVEFATSMSYPGLLTKVGMSLGSCLSLSRCSPFRAGAGVPPAAGMAPRIGSEGCLLGPCHAVCTCRTPIWMHGHHVPTSRKA